MKQIMIFIHTYEYVCTKIIISLNIGFANLFFAKKLHAHASGHQPFGRGMVPMKTEAVEVVEIR